MDILYLVGRLENLIASSKRMPLVNQIRLKESDILSIVDEMRSSIPDEVKQARRIIQDRDRIMAQAQAEAAALVARAREESERVMNREGLLRVAEERSNELLRQADEQAHELVRQAHMQTEQMKIDADAYVIETLYNIREHLTNVETEVSRTILSIEKGMQSLEDQQQQYEQGPQDENDEDFEEIEDIEEPHLPSQPAPRRASLANDTMGGPNYQ